MKTLIQTIECTTGTCGHVTHQITAGVLLLLATAIVFFVKTHKTDE